MGKDGFLTAGFLYASVREHAPLVTGDPEFRKLGKAIDLDWIK